MHDLLFVDADRPGLAAVRRALLRIDARAQQRGDHLVAVAFAQLAVQLLLAGRERQHEHRRRDEPP